MTYLVLKLLHVISVIAFVGNITTGVFWGARAHASRDFRLIASTFEGIIRSDRWFTGPGVMGVLVTGVAAAIVGGLPILGTGWILWGIVLFVVSGAVFGMRVAPLQREIAALAASGEANRTAYEKLYQGWALWGLVALLAPLGAVVLMVLKPPLPAV